MKANTYIIPFHPNSHEPAHESSDNLVLRQMREQANANTPNFLPKIGSCRKKTVKQSNSVVHSRLPHVDRRSQDNSMVDLKLDATLDTHMSKLGYTYITLPSEDDRLKSIFDASNISKKQEIVSPKKKTVNDQKDVQKKRVIAQRRFNVLKNKRTLNDESEDSEEEYMETTPGPGAYSVSDTFIKKTFRSKKPFIRDIFLTKQLKNKENKQKQAKKPIEIVENSTPPKKIGKEISFLSQSIRFRQKKQEHSAQVGSYKPRNSIQNDLINRLVRGLKGRFGSNVQRFTKWKAQQVGPGYYEHATRQNIYRLKPNSTYNSRVQRVIFEDKSNIPGPGDYDILKTQNQRDEILEKIKIKKAPFNSTEERTLFGRTKLRNQVKKGNKDSVKTMEQRLMAQKVMRA